MDPAWVAGAPIRPAAPAIAVSATPVAQGLVAQARVRQHASAPQPPAAPRPAGAQATAHDSTVQTIVPDSLATARDSTAQPEGRDSLAAAAPFRLARVATLVEHGVARGELVEPAGIAIDVFGRLFVSDAALHRLERYEPDGAPSGEAGTLGSAAGELRRPGSVALLGTLSVAVLDVENRRILLYDVNTRLQGTLVDFDDDALNTTLGRIEPRALASDRGGALYVIDAERDRLLVFDFSGRYVRTLGGFGDGPGSFRSLAAVAVGRRGELVAMGRSPRRLQWLDARGVPKGGWNLPGSSDAGAFALAVDDSMRIAVADERSGTVMVWDRSGTLLATRARFDRPRAVVFAPDGTLVIAEAGPGRLTRYRIEPRPTTGR